MQKILYLSYDGLTDPLGQSQILPYLISLTRLNYHFTIVSFEKRGNYKRRKSEIDKLIKDQNIDWLPMKYHKFPPVISAVYDLFKLTRAVRNLIKDQDIKIVHCRSYLTSLVGLEMKRKYGCRFIFDMRGFWADERVEGGLWNLRNPVYQFIYRYFKNKEREFLQEADHIVALTANAKKIIIKGELYNTSATIRNDKNNPLSISDNKIAVIPTCVNTRLFDPEQGYAGSSPEFNAVRSRLRNKWVLSYLGSIGTWYMLTEMLLFFKLLLERQPNVVFLFITQHPEAALIDKAKALDIPAEKVIVQPASRADVPYYLSLSRYNIFFIRPTFSKKASAATKMGEALAMNIPVITNTGWGDVEEVIEKEQCGLLIENFSEEDFQQAIDKILSGESYPRCRSTALKYFSLEAGVEAYRRIYQQLDVDNA